MPSTRIRYLRIFLVITFCVFGASQSAFATTCNANESPTANCTDLEINGSNLTITNPSGVIVESTSDSGAITDNGSNNTIVNHGEVRGSATFIPGSMAVTIYGTLSALTNTGAIGEQASNGVILLSAGPGASINTLSNSGSIASSYVGDAIYVESTSRIFSFTNSGYVGSFDGGHTAISAIGVNNAGTITQLNNTSAGVMMGINSAIINAPTGTITTLTNSGTMVGIQGSAIGNEGLISSLANLGVMEGQMFSSAIYNASTGTITSLSNSGTIRSTAAATDAISNEGTISTLTNSGTISSRTSYGIANNGTASLQTLTNTGAITGGVAGIYNWTAATIVTLNNAQGAGNPSGALTYTGKLPTNYNIIVNSPTSYGKLSASSLTGSTTFGIYSSSTLTKGTYTSVLSGFTAGTNVSATSGMFNGTGWQLIESGDGTGIWNLIADYSATNTLASVQQNSNGLATVYNQQAAAYQAALSYDCQVYDENNLCVSVGSRYTYAGPSPSSNQQAGLVILGYKPVQTFRVGAFADQSVNISTPSGFSQSKTSPMWGFFAKWHKNKDETGLGVQASVVTSSSSLTATRPQLFNTESGSGTTQFNGQGYQLTTNYHQPVTNNTSVVPYLGLRYTRINAGAYTENTTATVTSPLSYNAMAQNTFSAIAGLGVRSFLAEKLTGTASVGIQQNLNYSMGNYAGTSNITGLESFSVQMPGNVNSMATATAGMFYDINKRERVGLNVLWQQQPFIATNTTTAVATYTIGF